MAQQKMHLTVGDVARRSGLAVSAIHFYERKGLIFADRTGGNQRRYGRDVLRRLALIRAAQEVGLPLSEVADALSALPAGRTPTPEDWRGIATGWVGTISVVTGRLASLAGPGWGGSRSAWGCGAGVWKGCTAATVSAGEMVICTLNQHERPHSVEYHAASWASRQD